jgi:hypothetical protein
VCTPYLPVLALLVSFGSAARLCRSLREWEDNRHRIGESGGFCDDGDNFGRDHDNDESFDGGRGDGNFE